MSGREWSQKSYRTARKRMCLRKRGGKEHVTYKLYGRGLNLNMSIVYYIVVVFLFYTTIGAI